MNGLTLLLFYGQQWNFGYIYNLLGKSTMGLNRVLSVELYGICNTVSFGYIGEAYLNLIQ